MSSISFSVVLNKDRASALDKLHSCLSWNCESVSLTRPEVSAILSLITTLQTSNELLREANGFRED